MAVIDMKGFLTILEEKLQPLDVENLRYILADSVTGKLYGMFDVHSVRYDGGEGRGCLTGSEFLEGVLLGMGKREGDFFFSGAGGCGAREGCKQKLKMFFHYSFSGS